jgi:hypothetical protein
MPITRKVRDDEAPESNGENGERSFTSFMHTWATFSDLIVERLTCGPSKRPRGEELKTKSAA